MLGLRDTRRLGGATARSVKTRRAHARGWLLESEAEQLARDEQHLASVVAAAGPLLRRVDESLAVGRLLEAFDREDYRAMRAELDASRKSASA